MARKVRHKVLQVRPMRLGDLDSVMAIERASFAAPWARQVFIEELDRKIAHLWVGLLGEETVVGYANFWHVGDELHLLNVAVHPKWRRCGFARQVLTQMVEYGQHNGCERVTLEVRRSNQGAQKLYLEFGFRQVGVRSNYYTEGREDAIVMLLDLEQENS